MNIKRFMADFETATWLEDETYVWAWASCEIGNESNLKINNNIDSFIEYCKQNKNNIVYMHNLKFDGEFILYWLLTHNFKQAKTKEEIADNTFTTLISDFGVFYQITIYFKKNKKHTHKITFIDSLKLINFSVEEIAKYFDLSMQKLKLDYNKPRRRNHVLTESERNYIKNDILIPSKALKTLFDENLTKMTRASNALADYKEIISYKKFRHFFPVLDKILDEELRPSYKRRFYLSIS